MSKFKHNNKVIVSLECEDEQYAGLTGTVIDVVPNTDGLDNQVHLDRPVNGSSTFWFGDHELVNYNQI